MRLFPYSDVKDHQDATNLYERTGRDCPSDHYRTKNIGVCLYWRC